MFCIDDFLLMLAKLNELTAKKPIVTKSVHFHQMLGVSEKFSQLIKIK